MKKLVFLMVIIAVITSGCKKKSKSLDYSDSEPIQMVLQGKHQIQVSSEYDITYTILNTDPDKRVLTMPSEGMLYGFNVGHDKVKIDNGYESRIVDVDVSLFQVPTYEFGCSPSRIRQIYGKEFDHGTNPAGNYVLVYCGKNGYSYACGEMDFFFDDDKYFESDVYIRSSAEFLLDNYLNEEFTHLYDTQDTFSQDSIIPVSIYQNKNDETIFCGKRFALNEWGEIILFYFQHEEPDSIANCLKRRPRSSKFLY